MKLRILSFLLAMMILITSSPVSVFASETDDTKSLDDIAWEDLTYRDVFIENNHAYFDGFNQKTFSPYTQYAGTNTVTNEEFYTAPYSLKAFGNPSQQIKSHSALKESGDYFVASKVYCTRYVKGELGICIHSTTVGVTEVTDGFVTSSGIISANASENIFIGSIHSADLDGYVDDTVVVNMGIFEEAPSLDEMTALYDEYAEMEKSIEREEIPFTDEEALSAFIGYMNEKAAEIGMEHSNFTGPAGIDNTTTAKDIMKLMVHAYTEYDELNKIWCSSSHTVTVSGENARERTVTSTVIKDELGQYYKILGGKTGTLSNLNARNLAVILEIPDSEDKLAVVALYADGNDGNEDSRFQAAKEIADAAVLKYADPDYDNSETDVCCKSAIACLIPSDGADINNLQILYSKDAEAERAPASITKVLTAICALDYIKDFDEILEYNDFDTQIGIFYAKDFYPGDRVTFNDALFAMLLPSSNVTAQMIGRIAGEKIISANQNPCGENAFWRIENGILKISGSGALSDYEKAADVPWNSRKDEIVSLEIEEGITSVGKMNFANCDGIRSAALPESLESINKYAFWGCSALSEISLPDNLEKIGAGAFFGCSKLDHIEIPSGVTVLEQSVFAQCDNLETVILHDNITAIEKEAFSRCYALLHFTPPKMLETVGYHAFFGCAQLQQLTFAENLSEIGEAPFYGCVSLDSIRFTGNAPEFSEKAFLDITATVYYSMHDESWNGISGNSFGGTITWAPECFHQYTVEFTPPTCTEQGYMTHTCTLCGNSYVDSYIPATGHSYENGICTGCGRLSHSELNPVAENWPEFSTDLSHIICYGQSFSTGSDAPYYPDAPVDGVYVFGNISNSSEGTELSELGASCGNQHPIISAGNALAKMLENGGYETDIILGSYGSGGKTIAQLMSEERQQQIKEEEGYTYDILSSGRYKVFQNSVSAIAEYSSEIKKTVSCPAIVYLQGETDQNTDEQLGYPDNPVRAGYGAGGDKEKYKEYMTRLKNDMQKEVMEAYGQETKPLFIIYQVSGTYVRTKYSSINMAQIEFAQENDDVILLQSPYFTSHYTNSHHLTVNGYRWLGEYIAKYIYTALAEREKIFPLLPDDISIESSNKISITVSEAENGLSIDTWTVENATNSKNLYGFNLYVNDAPAVPEKLEISGNKIILTMPENSADLLSAESVYVQYGGQRASGTGNIRDNCTEKGFYEYLDDRNDTGTGNNQGVSHSSLEEDGTSLIGEKYPLYNWLASFSYEVKENSLHEHSYTKTVVPPECSKKGYTAYHCACGEAYAVDFTEPTGVHEYKPVITQPTCTEQGYTAYICSCGDIKEITDYVEALGHMEITDKALLPTAEREGLTEGMHCKVCGTVITEQKIVPPLGYGSMLEDNEFKILLIGNTFSEDAANYSVSLNDNQLVDALSAMLGEDIKVTVGLIGKGAASMAWHATQAEQERAKYTYFAVFDSDTETWNKNGPVYSKEALAWTDWDAVVLQPFSNEAHTGTANRIHEEEEDEKFYPLEESTGYMLDHVKKFAPDAEIYCFMHWQRTDAIKLNVNLSGHKKMAGFFTNVMDYSGTETGARYNKIIPVGTAVQNARTTYLSLLDYNTELTSSLKNDRQFGLQRDENHLSFNIGRYIAGLTFAETIIPEEMREEGYVLPDIRITESVGKLPKEYTEIAQKSVFAAVDGWKNGSLAVTEIEGYLEDPTVSAVKTLSGSELEVPFACDIESLEARISEAVLAALPEDFAVESVEFAEGFELTGEGQKLSAKVKIRFGYTFAEAEVSVSIGEALSGDINLDGKVNVMDAYYARLAAAKLITLTDEQKALGDVDGDGRITASDANYIRRFAVRIIDKLPVIN